MCTRNVDNLKWVITTRNLSKSKKTTGKSNFLELYKKLGKRNTIIIKIKSIKSL